jgi:hypothetical protein
MHKPLDEYTLPELIILEGFLNKACKALEIKCISEALYTVDQRKEYKQSLAFLNKKIDEIGDMIGTHSHQVRY